MADRNRYRETTNAGLTLPDQRPALLRYGVGLAVVVVSVFIAVWSRPFSQATPFLFFYPCVFFAVWFGGLGPGLLATVLSSAAANYFLLPPYDDWSFDNGSVVRTLLFAAGFAGICWLAELARRQLSSVIQVQSQLLDLTSDPIIVRDSEDRVIYWNQGAERLYGWSREEARGQVTHTLLQTKFPKPLDQVLAEFKETGRWHGELTHTRKDGSTVVVASSWTLGQRDRQVAVLEASYDLTDRKKTEQTLSESRETLETIFNSVYDGIVVHSTTGEMLQVNDRFLAMYNITREDVALLEIADISSSLSPIESLPSIWAKVMAGQWQLFEWKAKRPHDGSVFDVEVFLHRLRLHDGTEAVLANVRDITGRKRAETALVEAKRAADTSLAQLRATLDSMSESVFVCDAQGKPLLANPALLRFCGLNESEISHGLTDFYSLFELLDLKGDRVPQSEWPVNRALRGETVNHLELRLRRIGHAAEFIAAYNAVPVRDSNGNIEMAVVTFEDITTMKQAQRALIRSEKLAATGRLAATIAHEINNPLEAITNIVYLLGQQVTDPEARDYVRMIETQLSTVSRIATQTLKFHRENGVPVEFDLAQLTAELLDFYESKAKQHGVKIQRRLLQPANVVGFTGEIRQVVSNLVINAIEATPEGGNIAVHLYESVDWRDPLKRGYRLSVIDTGVGIAPEHRSRIFEPFFTTKGERGTGLGLWVSMGIVTRAGGSMRVRSTRGEKRSGTCFSLFLPAEIAVTEHRGRRRYEARHRAAG